MKNKHEATAWRVSTALSGEMARKLREGLPVAVIRTIVCLSRFIASNNAGIPLEFRELQRVTHVYFRATFVRDISQRETLPLGKISENRAYEFATRLCAVFDDAYGLRRIE